MLTKGKFQVVAARTLKASGGSSCTLFTSIEIRRPSLEKPTKSLPESRKNKKCVKEPDELLKTSHLKSDTMPDADGCSILKHLIGVPAVFPIFDM